MKHWRILGIGDDPWMLSNIKREVLHLSPGCLMDLVTTFEDGQQLLLMYTYNVIIADFGSPVTRDLAAFITEQGLPVVAISQNGCRVPAFNIACVSHSESPEEIGPAALRLLPHQSFLHLRRVCKKILMWPSRILFSLVPNKANEIALYERPPFY
ncbi:MAG: hypothetical protein K9M96_01305 [Deltaproteobacteria bacterium]|nr:hypothetical protein [Deltaproteobacteria bacterium]